MNYKNIVLGFWVLFFMAPVLLFAQDGPKNTFQNNDAKAGFCTQIKNLSSNMVSRMLEREQKIGSFLEQRRMRIEEGRGSRDGKLNEYRERWEENRAENFAKIAEKLSTDAEKQAFVTLKIAVEAAIAARKMAVDAAVTAFRNGVDAKVVERKTAIEKLVADFKTAVDAAYTKAKSDCDSGTGPQTVRQTLTDALKAARDKYNADKKTIEKNTTAVNELAEIKNAAIKKAVEDFRAAVVIARADFKAAVGK